MDFFSQRCVENKLSNTFQINALRVIAYWQLAAIPGRIKETLSFSEFP